MEKDLTKGSVFRVLVWFSLPYLFSCFLQMLYGMVDLYVTGQFNTAAAISAVSIGSQVMHMLTVMIVGLAMGSTVGLGMAIGGRQTQKAGRIVGNTVSLFAVGSVLLVAVLFFATDGILKVMSVPEEAVSQTKAYLQICFAGIPFITAYNVISCIYRGLGDSRSPMYFVGAACVLNIILDYLFIGPLALGAAGAALGTVISQAASVGIALIFLSKKDLGFRMSLRDLRPERSVLGDILKVGVPVACQDGFIQVSFLLITMIANQRGVDVAAAVGIVEKIISFLFLVPSAMLSSISAIAAQDRGAGLPGRAKKTLYYGIAASVAFGLFFTVICQFASEPIVGLFSSEKIVRKLGGEYLRSYVLDSAIAGIHFCFSGFFCAYGLSGFSFLHNLISIVLVRVPGAYLAAQLFPDSLFPMGLAAPAGSALSSVICVILFLAFRKRFQEEPVPHSA